MDETHGDVHVSQVLFDFLFDRDFCGGHFLLHPDRFDLIALVQESSREVGDDVLGQAKTNAEVTAMVFESRTQIVDGFSDESEAVAVCTSVSGGLVQVEAESRSNAAHLALKAPVFQNLYSLVLASGPLRWYPGSPDNSSSLSSNT